jgi:hypothetical protein
MLNQPLVLLAISANTTPVLAAHRRPTTTTTTTEPTATPPPTTLGSVTFGIPRCGDLFLGGIPDSSSGPLTASDCDTAFQQVLDAHCTSGICDIPASPLSGGESAVEQTFGTCLVAVAYKLGNNGATFNEAPVEDEFPVFVGDCTQIESTQDGLGSPTVVSTNGALQLSFTISGPVE